jgi:xanthine dehydrogenase accessory factor
MNLLEDLCAAAARGGALCTVIEATGSTPRHVGARMAVLPDGGLVGTIGGGRVEQEVAAAAREVIAGGPARRVRHHLVRDLAMCCGGTMELVIAPLAPSAPALQAMVRARAERRATIVETPLDGGPLRVRPATVDELARRRPERAGHALIELVRPLDRVILFGAGHVARAIGPLARSCGYQVVVCDDGDTGAVDPPPPWAHAVVDSFDPADLVRQVGPLGAGDHVLIVTRDHAVDQRVLEQLIGRDDLSYLGMIGSRGKVGRFHKRLAAKGLVDDASWARLRAPIGLDLGAETPEEIAVAVMAELIALRRRGEPRAGDWRPHRVDGGRPGDVDD